MTDMFQVEWGGAAWARYDGLLFSGSGKSRAEKAAENQQATEQAFYDQLTQEMQSRYQQQSALLDQLKSLFQPVVNEGPNQYGFNAGEDAALRTQAAEGTAQGYQEAAKALGTGMAAKDMTGLPSGASAEMLGSLANAAAQQNAARQLGITQAGYQQGLAQYDRALAGLGGLVDASDPLGFAGAANQAGMGITGYQGAIPGLASQEASPFGAMLGGLSSLFGMGAGAGAGAAGAIGDAATAEGGVAPGLAMLGLF